LQQNYPNPFNPSTTIEYDLPEDGRIALVIYNNLGQKIRTLYEGTQLAGTHRISWDGRDDRGKALASGVYFYTLKAANIVQTKKMLLIH
ncbi:MAG: T9SS type A sorting domain-containing protein, partial [Calditrichaeota bacterium]|nr:T9SS type A sorting domain-containing protein [Calditrichota bacterium]